MLHIVRIPPYKSEPALTDIWATNVFPLDDYKLLLEFSTGEKRIFDCKSLLYKPEFMSLLDKTKFNAVMVYDGDAAWPDEKIGLNGEALYYQSEPAHEALQLLFPF